MVCDECGKNKATVHLTEIINEQITKLNLCEGCAKAKGTDAEQHFGIADLLAALSDVEAKASHASPGTGAPQTQGAASKIKCARCGLTYDDFKKMGRLGCGECYTTFKASLSPLLKKIHGSSQHLGKMPGAPPAKETKTVRKFQEELAKVKEQLAAAIKKEEFEEAAALRDKIKFLEKKTKETKG